MPGYFASKTFGASVLGPPVREVYHINLPLFSPLRKEPAHDPVCCKPPDQRLSPAFPEPTPVAASSKRRGAWIRKVSFLLLLAVRDPTGVVIYHRRAEQNNNVHPIAMMTSC